MKSMTPLAAMHYKLLGPVYTRAFRCLWMLEEVTCGGNLSYEFDETYKPLSRKTTHYNPAGKVPVLLEFRDKNDKEPCFSLTESTAINTYLGTTAHSRQGTTATHPLVPTDPHHRAHYDAMIAYLLTEVDAALWLLAKHTTEPLLQHFGAVPDCRDPCHKELQRAHARLVPTLTPYLLGTTFSAADILYCHCIEWQRSMDKASIDSNIEIGDGLLSYLRQCRERPAYQRAHAIRKLSLAASPHHTAKTAGPKASL